MQLIRFKKVHYQEIRLFCAIKSFCDFLFFVIFLALVIFQVRLSSNVENIRTLFLKIKPKLGLYYFVPTTSNASPEKLTLTEVEMQQLPNIENTDPLEHNSCLKSPIYFGERNVCVNLQTDRTS